MRTTKKQYFFLFYSSHKVIQYNTLYKLFQFNRVFTYQALINSLSKYSKYQIQHTCYFTISTGGMEKHEFVS